MLRRVCFSTTGNQGFFATGGFSWASTNSGFTIRTGFAAPHATSLRAEPLSDHAAFPFEFPRKARVGILGGLLPSTFCPSGLFNERRRGALPQSTDLFLRGPPSGKGDVFLFTIG